MPISVVSREDGSGTRGAFVELMGILVDDVDMTTLDAAITNGTSVMMTTVAGNPYAIGYISLGSVDSTIKALDVDGVQATAENVKAGTYKVSRPFNIATKGDVSEVAQDFINYIMSAEGQQVVVKGGYLAVVEGEAFVSNGASGKVVIAGSSSVSPIMEKLIEAYKAVNSGAEIELQTSDSSAGMQNVVDGVCDIGMASRELKDTETGAGAEGLKIATDGIAVIVNNSNSTTGLTAEQIRAIFTGEITTWSELDS